MKKYILAGLSTCLLVGPVANGMEEMETPSPQEERIAEIKQEFIRGEKNKQETKETLDTENLAVKAYFKDIDSIIEILLEEWKNQREMKKDQQVIPMEAQEFESPTKKSLVEKVKHDFINNKIDEEKAIRVLEDNMAEVNEYVAEKLSDDVRDFAAAVIQMWELEKKAKEEKPKIEKREEEEEEEGFWEEDDWELFS